MKRYILVALFVLALALGALAGTAEGDNGNGPPATNPGSPGDDCSHGNSDKPCKDDPQPDKGKECDDHGNARGNEDHCDEAPVVTTPEDPPTETEPPDDTTPTDTTPEDTTSTPTDTTPAATTPVVPATAAPAAQPAVAPAVKAKAVAKKKAATKIVKVVKKPKGVVVITTADGKKHVGVMGSG